MRRGSSSTRFPTDRRSAGTRLSPHPTTGQQTERERKTERLLKNVRLLTDNTVAGYLGRKNTPKVKKKYNVLISEL